MPLTPQECVAITVESIRRTVGFSGQIVPSMRLLHVGVRDEEAVQALLYTIASSLTHGARRYGMRLDLEALSEVSPETQIGSLGDLIMLSALPGEETFPDE